MLQDKLRHIYVNTIGILGFVFLLLAFIYVIVKFPKMILSRIEEQAESMDSENTFFTAIQFEESMDSLQKKFLRAGFSQRKGFLHKKSFSFAKDYINYYVFIVENTDMEQYVNNFLMKIDTFIKGQKRLHKNNYICLIFFKSHISNDELIPLKNLIIHQDVIQGIPHYQLDTVVPIVYDIGKQEYILRINNRKLSLRPIDIAMKKFCNVVFRK